MSDRGAALISAAILFLALAVVYHARTANRYHNVEQTDDIADTVSSDIYEWQHKGTEVTPKLRGTGPGWRP